LKAQDKSWLQLKWNVAFPKSSNMSSKSFKDTQTYQTFVTEVINYFKKNSPSFKVQVWLASKLRNRKGTFFLQKKKKKNEIKIVRKSTN